VSRAPENAEVGIYYDTDESVRIGDIIQTKTGRRYGVVRCEHWWHCGELQMFCGGWSAVTVDGR
jgi:hypothetical protein